MNRNVDVRLPMLDNNLSRISSLSLPSSLPPSLPPSPLPTLCETSSNARPATTEIKSRGWRREKGWPPLFARHHAERYTKIGGLPSLVYSRAHTRAYPRYTPPPSPLSPLYRVNVRSNALLNNVRPRNGRRTFTSLCSRERERERGPPFHDRRGQRPLPPPRCARFDRSHADPPGEPLLAEFGGAGGREGGEHHRSPPP